MARVGKVPRTYIIVEHCPQGLFNRGAKFGIMDFNLSLRLYVWPDGMVVSKNGQLLEVQGDRTVEIKEIKHDAHN